MPSKPRPPLRGAFAGRLPGFRFATAFFAVLLAVLAGVVAVEILRTVGNALERPGVPDFYSQSVDIGAGDPGSIIKADALLRDADEADRQAVESKIEGVAFGFLVPIFFIYTGITFDLAALLADPVLLWLVPVTVLALLVVRGIPSMLAAPPGASGRERIAVGLLGATGLPIIVAVTAIGVDENLISTAQSAVLVGAGMLTVLLLPLIGMKVRQRAVPHASPVAEDDLA